MESTVRYRALPNPDRRAARRALALLALFLGAAAGAAGAGPAAAKKARKPKAGKILLLTSYSDARASSSREDPNGAPLGYSPINAVDSEPRTAWCADQKLLGIGEWIEIGLFTPVSLTRLGAVATVPPPDGKIPPDGGPLPFNRAHRVKIASPIGEERFVEFDDTARLQYKDLDEPLSGDRFRLTVESVYPGEERALTCLSEIEFWGASEPEGAAVDALARKAITSDVRKVFDDAFGGQRAALAGPRLKTAFNEFFGRYQNYSPVSLVQEVVSEPLPGSLLHSSGEAARPGETACVAALRGLYEATPWARRYLREKYFLQKKVALGEGCGIQESPLYWVFQGRGESIPIFWSRAEYYGLLELGDARALEPFLARYRGEQAPYEWWRKGAAVHSAQDRTPLELVGRLQGPYARRVLTRLIEQSKDQPGYYLDGLRALLRAAGGN